MSLITTPVPGYTPTTQDKQTAFKEFVIQSVNGALKYQMSCFTQIYNQIWNSKVGLTPQQCFDALGTDAAQLLAISVTMQTAVNSLANGMMDFTPPNPHTLTANSDGTVTVS